MSGRSFFDTNILIYADDADAGAKQKKAQALLSEGIEKGTAVFSTQVLQEYFSVATRKLGVPAEVARRKIDVLASTDVVIIRPDLILGAIDLHRLHRLAFWDALIIKSAAAAKCSRVLSEDLNHGESIDGVRVENPFLK